MFNDNHYQPVPEIKFIFFDYHNEEDENWGQITFQDKWNENIGVLNFDEINKKDFLSIFRLWQNHLGKGINLEFSEL